MTTPIKIDFSPQAKIDLRNIFDYTARIFGVDQAENYYNKINDRINMLLNYPELGTKKDEIRVGYRALMCESHVAYYSMFENEIRIARLLHQQMDPERHLH